MATARIEREVAAERSGGLAGSVDSFGVGEAPVFSTAGWPGDGGKPRTASGAFEAPVLPARTLRLFGLDLCDTTREAAAGWIVARAAMGVATRISFVNAHCVNVMYRDATYRSALKSSDRIFVDGSGMMLAARSVGLQLTENLNGTDLFPVMCRRAAEAGIGVFLFGGREGIARECGQRMTDGIAGLRIAGSHHGYVKTAADEDAIIREINASGAKILLVGLGVPSQETWIARNSSRLSVPVVVGVGGLFDYFSGRIPRAPLALRKLGLEWVWRMAMEPRRLARRYLLGNVEFLLRLAQVRLSAPHEFGSSGAQRP